MSYGNFHGPLLPWHRFVSRLVGNFIATVVLVGGALGLGMWGYAYFEHMSLIDAFLNATIILAAWGRSTR